MRCMVNLSKFVMSSVFLETFRQSKIVLPKFFNRLPEFCRTGVRFFDQSLSTFFCFIKKQNADSVILNYLVRDEVLPFFRDAF